ncbi:MAG TPA: hypothetical protein VFL59_09740 [Candidatus Nanopelagicales bacterium]|nr:hypothetical protein [Candidatus Nanopelagicales bacterium]
MSPWWVGALLASALLLLRPPRAGGAALPSYRPRPWRSGRRVAALRRTAELEWLDALAAELGGGQDPSTALASLPGSALVCPRALAAARTGADVAGALRADGGSSQTVRAAGACWDVAAGSGAGLAASLTVLADAVRDDDRVRAELEAGVAEPRATAFVLAGLPLVGLALGAGLGAQPLDWLLGTAAGRAVLLAGVALEVAGAAWSWRIATSLEGSL